jgi:hypothetical protein
MVHDGMTETCRPESFPPQEPLPMLLALPDSQQRNENDRDGTGDDGARRDR